MINNIIKNKKFLWCGLVALIAVIAILIVIMAVKPGDKEPSVDAGKLYEYKVEDINDTALVAELFEEMELEEIAGEYTVEISQEGETLVLAINVLKDVQNAEKQVFDANMEMCAEQMLALMPQVGRVQWTYPVITDGSKEESSVESLDRVEFASNFGKAPEYYGKSEENLKKLLEKQKKL